MHFRRWKRREFITLLGGAAAWPLAARAAGRKRYTIGLLSPGAALATEANFIDALREFGWVEGKDIVFERRYAENRPARLPELAADLVRLKVDVIAAGATRTEVQQAARARASQLSLCVAI